MERRLLVETKVISTKETPDFGQTFNFFIYLSNKGDMSKKLTTEKFIEKAKLIHGDKYNYTLVKYVNNHTKIKLICSTHGEFEQRPNDHISKKTGCPLCSGKGRTTEKFIEELKKVHGSNFDYSKVVYTGIDNNINIVCLNHGEFFQSAYTHLKGHGCPKCKNEKLSIMNLSSLEYFINKAKVAHGDRYDYSLVDYKKGTIKVKIQCKQHGLFEQIPDSHLQGRGCPLCSESKGEKKVSKILSEINIDYVREKKFDNCKGEKSSLRFDFYLPDYSCCIEYDGKQHFEYREGAFGASEEKAKINFEKLKINDERKNKFCLANAIKLIRIKFDDSENEIFNKIKEIVYGKK